MGLGLGKTGFWLGPVLFIFACLKLNQCAISKMKYYSRPSPFLSTCSVFFAGRMVIVASINKIEGGLFTSVWRSE